MHHDADIVMGLFAKIDQLVDVLRLNGVPGQALERSKETDSAKPMDVPPGIDAQKVSKETDSVMSILQDAMQRIERSQATLSEMSDRVAVMESSFKRMLASQTGSSVLSKKTTATVETFDSATCTSTGCGKGTCSRGSQASPEKFEVLTQTTHVNMRNKFSQSELVATSNSSMQTDATFKKDQRCSARLVKNAGVQTIPTDLPLPTASSASQTVPTTATTACNDSMQQQHNNSIQQQQATAATGNNSMQREHASTASNNSMQQQRATAVCNSSTLQQQTTACNDGILLRNSLQHLQATAATCNIVTTASNCSVQQQQRATSNKSSVTDHCLQRQHPTSTQQQQATPTCHNNCLQQEHATTACNNKQRRRQGLLQDATLHVLRVRGHWCLPAFANGAHEIHGWKTRLCRFAETGCPQGNKCSFAHSAEELRQT